MNKDNTITVQIKPGSWEIMLKNILASPPMLISHFSSDSKEEIIKLTENLKSINDIRYAKLATVGFENKNKKS